MTQEDPIRQALRTAVLAGEPAAAEVKQAVLREAGRLEFRRRLAAGAAVVAVLGVLSAGGWAVAGGRDGEDPSLPAAQPSSPVAKSAHPAQAFVDGMAILQVISRFVPPGVEAGDAQTQQGWARVVLSDAAGRSTLEVNVQPGFGQASKGGVPGLHDCSQVTGPGQTCETGRLPDGSPFVVVQGPTGDQAPGAGVVQRTVAVVQPGGLRVVVSVFNAVDVKHGRPTRTEPVLTVAQVTEMAADPAWRG